MVLEVWLRVFVLQQVDLYCNRKAGRLDCIAGIGLVELQYKIVLQQVLYCRGCWRYVAIQILYCRQLAGKAVSRYKICIMTKVAGIGLQYKILYCG